MDNRRSTVVWVTVTFDRLKHIEECVIEVRETGKPVKALKRRLFDQCPTRDQIEEITSLVEGLVQRQLRVLAPEHQQGIPFKAP
jgi:hypothetical protein